MPASDPRSRLPIAIAIALPFVVAGILIGWTQLGSSCTSLEDVEPGRRTFSAAPCITVSDDFVYRLEMDTTSGPLRIVMDPILACETVNNLVFLTRAGFYDEMTIHKVEVTEDHAFLQIGDPTGTGRGNAGYTYTAEPPSPVTRYQRGMAAMVFAGDDPSTASSQFFVVIDDYAELSYPARQPINTLFGGTSDPESLRTLDVIASLPRDGTRPRDDVVIRDASISEQRRFGEEGDPFVPCDQEREIGGGSTADPDESPSEEQTSDPAPSDTVDPAASPSETASGDPRRNTGLPGDGR